ncbi:conserved repeat domain-containing protein/gliding motility-associated C-terminal domain-containing protein, partial [Algoriphagus ornithinivorans]
SYTFKVTNTGNVTLSNIVLEDDKVTVSGGPITSLAPGASDATTFTASYVLTQEDIDAGKVLNLAVARGEAPGGDPNDPSDDVTAESTDPTPVSADERDPECPTCTVTILPRTASLSIDKAADKQSISEVGEVITYTLTVTNDGNVTLTDIVVNDPLTGFNATIPSLAPGASEELETSYTVTQEDLDRGFVSNVATATTTYGEEEISAEDEETVVVADMPSLTIDKVADKQSISEVGEVITYTLTVTNDGNVTLTDIVVNDPLTGFNTTISSLAPGASEELETSYTVTQEDLDRGFVRNVATATTTYGEKEISAEDEETVVVADMPSLTIDKVADKQSISEVGEVITYTLTVTNDGNVTLTDIVVNDPLTGFSATISSLAPGASEELETSYTVTQEDLDRGFVRNVATATTTYGEEEISAEDEETVVVADMPSLTIDKVADKQSISEVGEVITYTLTVTNDGNVTLTDIVVNDPLTGFSATISSLAPGASEELETSYTVTQEDLDRGFVRNVATATTTYGEKEISAEDEETVTVSQSPSISIVKTSDVSSVSTVGQVITYTLTVTNTGNVTLTNIVVNDPLTGFTETIPSLNSNQSVTFQTSYTVTAADLNKGSIVNVATATTSFNEQPVTAEDDAIVTVDQNPSISIVKTSDVSSVSTIGQVITYTLTVTNTGNVTLTNIVVNDPLTGFTETIPSLNANQSVTFQTSYTVTAADLNNGSIVNVATASSNFNEQPVTAEDDATVTVDQNPSISIVKTSDVSSVSTVGQVITYTLTVTNTGNVTLTNIVVNDPLTGFTENISSLGQGQSVVFTTTYVVEQGDLDSGSIVNVATASTNFNEQPVNAEDEAIVTVDGNPSILIVKSSDVESVTLADQVITYTLTVTNTGNITLTNVLVNDPLTGFENTISTLAPGQVVEFTTSYTVTQEDIDSGEVENIASVTGNAGVEEVSDTDTLIVPAVQNPDIQIEITDNDAVITEAGQEIPYTITVTNTGNVTLTNVTVVDTKTGLVVNIGTLKPGETKTVETTYPVTQEDVDAGQVTNDASVTGQSPNPGDDDPTDSDSVTTPITPAPGISIVKSSDKSEIRDLGETVTYTLVVTNTGNVTLTNILVSDPLTGLNEVIETLAPGESVTIETSYVVTQEDLDRGSLLNVASVSGETPDGEQIGDEDEVSIGVGIREIIANDDDFGTYFVSYGGRLGNILENDLLDGQRPDPADVDFEFTELDGVIGLLIDENGDLSLIPGVNEAREYTLRYVLREVANPNNSDDAFVVFRLLNDNVNLGVSKEALSDEVFEGDEFEYEIVVVNQGGTDARNVVITDNLPNGVTYLSNRVESNSANVEVNVNVSGSAITWRIPFFPADARIVFRVRVKAGAAGTVTNTVIVGADEDDTDESDNQDSDVTEIRPFHIPNVITPNNDGLNDTFEIQGLNKFVSNRIVIFNRYGDHVLEAENYKNDWNAPGQVAGTYFYVLVTVDSQGREHVFKGWIQVIWQKEL